MSSTERKNPRKRAFSSLDDGGDDAAVPTPASTTNARTSRATLPVRNRGPPEIQTRLRQVARHGFLRAEDSLFCKNLFINRAVAGSPEVFVNAHLVCTGTGSTAGAVDFDIIENGSRTFLGSFTGAHSMVVTLIRRASGLAEDGKVATPGQPGWEEFDVYRNGQLLGTLSELRAQTDLHITSRRQLNQASGSQAPATTIATTPAATPTSTPAAKKRTAVPVTFDYSRYNVKPPASSKTPIPLLVGLPSYYQQVASLEIATQSLSIHNRPWQEMQIQAERERAEREKEVADEEITDNLNEPGVEE